MAPSTDRAALRRPYYQRRYLRIVLGIAFTGALMGVFIVYPPLRVAWYSMPAWQPGPLSVLAVSLVPVLGRLAHEVSPGVPTRIVSAIALTWLGLSFMFAPVVALVDLVNGFQPLPRPVTGYALIGAAAAAAVIGFAGAQILRVRTLRISGGGRARGRLVQISDVHIGSRLPGLLRRVVRLANAQQPDLHLITGDLVDFKGISVRELAALGELNAPCYFVIGNHERYVDLEPICERLRALGVGVLRNESATCGDFHVLGIDDAETQLDVDGIELEVRVTGTGVGLNRMNGMTWGAYAYGRDVDAAAAVLATTPEIGPALITHRFPLDAAPEAFVTAASRNSGVIKVVLEPGH